MKKIKRHFTQEEKDFIKDNVKGIPNVELTKLFNEHFGENFTETQIYNYKRNHFLTNDVDTRFKKGNRPKHIFPNGETPINARPVGSERIGADGYVSIKVSQKGRWKKKHHVVWEQVHGKIPKGSCLIFLDGNKLNTSLENLALVTRDELGTLNGGRLLFDNAELSKSGILIAKIIRKIDKKEK